jgi:proliferating cell nuclear antigen
MSITNWEEPNKINEIKENHSLYVVSGQISKIKTLFEVIKDIVLEDINIIFEKDFITIIKENSNKKSMVHLKLETEFFEFYHINEEKIIIGVDSVNFYKVIKTAKNDETIAFYCKKNHVGQKKFIVRLENSSKKTVSEDEFIVLDFREEVSLMPEEVEYPGSIITQSKDFQRIFKNIKSKSTKRSNKRVEIIHTGEQLIFNYNGEYSKQTISLGESKILKNGNELYSLLNAKTEMCDKVENNDINIIQGIYDLDYLLIFAKATNLNANMLIRIQNDMPLILNYKIGVLGNLYLLLNPIEDEL